MEKPVVFSLNLETAVGPLTGDLTFNDCLIDLSEIVPIAINIADTLVEKAIAREEARGKTVRCGAGCGACCRQLVMISIPEALFLLETIDTLEKDERDTLLQRFAAIQATVEELGLLQEIMSPSFCRKKQHFPITEKYFHLDIPCPFLVNESCTIHESRPTVCRDYNVTSAKEMCSAPYTNKIEKVPAPLAITATLSKTTAALTGRRMELIPLSLVHYWSQSQKQEERQQYRSVDLFTTFFNVFKENLS